MRKSGKILLFRFSLYDYNNKSSKMLAYITSMLRRYLISEKFTSNPLFALMIRNMQWFNSVSRWSILVFFTIFSGLLLPVYAMSIASTPVAAPAIVAEVMSDNRINEINKLITDGKLTHGYTLLREFFLEVKRANNGASAKILLSIAELARTPAMRGVDKANEPSLCYIAYREASVHAEQHNDMRSFSLALGFMGQLYEEEARFQEALNLTQKALFAAQQIHAVSILSQWQWQVARLLARLQRNTEALDAYRQAIYMLNAQRQGRVHGTSFNKKIKPVFFELADLLLQQSLKAATQKQKEAYLLEAQTIVEQFKVAELEDYFQDECAVALQSKQTGLENIGTQTVVIYPIILPDRMEILLHLPSGMKRYSVNISAKRLASEIKEFRSKLEKRTTRQYLYHAKKLYDWLIAPLDADLKAEGIKTMVFVPDGALRTIPIAALHDGKQFLVEKYAIAITPGLTLIDPKPLKRNKLRLLVSALTQSVQGFSALPNVADEVEFISDNYPVTLLQDENFVIEQFETELKQTPYTIVHIASHGQFDKDPEKTFLLTFDGKLTINKLEQYIRYSRFREQPVELLTLSACQTAAGDDRAALGLAGVAIKAGARSALATLWFINDKATSVLIGNFYKKLKKPSNSKAQSLQQAQQFLLQDLRYRHPGNWSPFLLIGNWL